MKKTVYIKLKRTSVTLGEVYTVEQLKNAAQVSLTFPSGTRYFRVGDTVSPETADQLCDNRNYEVTVTI